MTEGAEESYGLTSDKGNITIHFKKYDNESNDQKGIFVIPLPNN